jgi:hypothetical protein
MVVMVIVVMIGMLTMMIVGSGTGRDGRPLWGYIKDSP